jgi:hypothetical protein
VGDGHHRRHAQIVATVVVFLGSIQGARIHILPRDGVASAFASGVLHRDPSFQDPRAFNYEKNDHQYDSNDQGKLNQSLSSGLSLSL